jgi:hypothetical protein
MHVNRAVWAGADDVALSAREHGDISGRTSIDIRPSVAVLSADAEDSGELHMPYASHLGTPLAELRV